MEGPEDDHDAGGLKLLDSRGDQAQGPHEGRVRRLAGGQQAGAIEPGHVIHRASRRRVRHVQVQEDETARLPVGDGARIKRGDRGPPGLVVVVVVAADEAQPLSGARVDGVDRRQVARLHVLSRDGVGSGDLPQVGDQIGRRPDAGGIRQRRRLEGEERREAKKAIEAAQEVGGLGADGERHQERTWPGNPTLTVRRIRLKGNSFVPPVQFERGQMRIVFPRATAINVPFLLYQSLDMSR